MDFINRGGLVERQGIEHRRRPSVPHSFRGHEVLAGGGGERTEVIQCSLFTKEGVITLRGFHALPQQALLDVGVRDGTLDQWHSAWCLDTPQSVVSVREGRSW